ncbi:hypothetical protein ROSEINA2194_03046 [Roseburia inulinivorans DSM 16841]|uniref:Uncharacterized protein n=1 Tax=Roseburia inulinivorans DSM 16841 TaxID=622312 RepID=C0FWC0_9FIRM|nr:hypothetical protein ROSEINA2194_03046 [Roseburia inulinivorans DSM 16841]
MYALLFFVFYPFRFFLAKIIISQFNNYFYTISLLFIQIVLHICFHS